MPDPRTRIVLGVLLAIVLLGSGTGFYLSRRPAPPPIVITPPPAAPAPAPVAVSSPAPPTTPAVVSTPKPASPPGLYVHVAGAVKHPTLYCLPVGSRVMNAVKAAGGPRPDADLDAVNLAEKIRDGEKIYIPARPTAPQTTAMLAPPGNAIGHSSIVPSTAPAPPSTPAAPSKAAKATKSAKGGLPKADKITSPAQGQVNINTATADQLERLPGIGPAMAARILAYRQQAGGFQKIDELQDISGIGPKKYAKIAPLVKLQ